MDRPIFGGEIVVAPDGMYTFAKTYFHPQTRQTVLLVAMNHFGDPGYFENILRILSRCSYVLYEGMGPKAGEEYKDLLDRLEKVSAERTPKDDQVFDALVTSLSDNIGHYIKENLQKESVLYPHYGANWLPGEEGYWERLARDEAAFDVYVNAHIARYHSETAEYKEIMTRHVSTFLERFMTGAWERADFGRYFEAASQKMRHYPIWELELEREVTVMRKLNEVLMRANATVVAIKFGAYHIPAFRSHILMRGFVHTATERLCALAF